MSQIIADKYEVLAEISCGAAGTVYKVRHTVLDSIATLTLLPEPVAGQEDRYARMYRTVRDTFELRHDHITPLQDFGRDGENRYYAVEAFAPGETLEEVLRKGALPAADALEIALQLADALVHAHERGVVHGALTPATVRVQPGTPPQATLTSFGLGEAAAGLLPPPGLLAYTPPERLASADVELDARADVFALGLLLFEMLDGRAFFVGLSEDQIRARLLDDAEPLMPRFSVIAPAGIPAVVARAIRRAPGGRQQSMLQLRQEIAGCLARLDAKRNGASATAAEEAPPPTPARPERPAAPRKAAKLNSESDSAERMVAERLLRASGRMPVAPGRGIVTSRATLIAALVVALGCYAAWRHHAVVGGAPARIEPETVASPRTTTMAEAHPALEVGPPAREPRQAATPEPAPEAPVARADETPRPERRIPPRIVSTSPRRGTAVSVIENRPIEFSVAATDGNAGDRLHYTWFLDGHGVSRKASWRFVAPPAATATAHTVAVQVIDGTGLAAPRVTWTVAVSPLISGTDVRDWLDRLAAAWERKDLTTLRLYGVVASDAEAGAVKREFACAGKVRVSVGNEAIRTEGEYATVKFDLASFDRSGTLVSLRHEWFDLEKRADGFVAVRAD